MSALPPKADRDFESKGIGLVPEIGWANRVSMRRPRSRRHSGPRGPRWRFRHAGNHHLERVSASRSADELWAKYIGSLPAGRDLRRQDSPWSRARRPASRAADKV